MSDNPDVMGTAELEPKRNAHIAAYTLSRQ
jgi:hypothetical protein